jgi:hypothetical protein
MTERFAVPLPRSMSTTRTDRRARICFGAGEIEACGLGLFGLNDVFALVSLLAREVDGMPHLVLPTVNQMVSVGADKISVRRRIRQRAVEVDRITDFPEVLPSDDSGGHSLVLIFGGLGGSGRRRARRPVKSD